MNRKCLIIVTLLLVLISQELQAQLKKPNPPKFDYLTIDLDTGNPTLFWTAPAFDPLYENPIGYVIQKDMFVSGLWTLNEPFDTVASNVFTYTDFTANGNLSKVRYSIKSLGLTEASQQTSNHSNIFITSFYDSCNHKIDLTWQNYEGWGNKIEKYDVYIGSTPNWATFTLLYSLPGNKSTASILNVNENQDYYVYIEAKKLNDVYTTKSNLFHKFTDMPIHPNYMAVDSIIAEDKKVNIYFRIDPATELSNFQVVRWENSDSVKSIFSKKDLYSFSDPTIVHYGDTVDSWAARTRPFYYKVDALNTCPKIIKVTNHANTTIPIVHSTWHTCHIAWNELFIDSNRVKLGNYPRYRVTRYAYTTVPMPPAYLPETDQLELNDTVHIFEGQGYSAKFCYQIEAYERNTIGATVMLSRSRIQCTEVIPGVIMPDAIAPNDPTVNNGNARNFLTPIITFNANYTLSIYNRWGNLIFYGVNNGWNGRIPGGALAREGTYVYRLVVSTSGNQDVVKTGNITVVYH
jgi:hypothetical protein